VADVWPGITWAEPIFLFERAEGTYREVARERGTALARPFPGRGLATGDYDNDGDVDVLLLTVGESPRLFRNDGGNRRAWLGVQLIGTTSPRDAIGAQVLVTAGGVTQRRVMAGGTSYCAVSDRRLLFGLGEASRVERVEVRWPGGRADIMRDVAVGRYITIREGS
jgi:enediyne biosynthesis protein E4